MDFYKGDRASGNWRWAYFGDVGIRRVLFIVHQQADDSVDTFSHLGNSDSGLESGDGMVVFGTGRGPEGIAPLLTGTNSFRIVLIEKDGKSDLDYEEIRNNLDSVNADR